MGLQLVDLVCVGDEAAHNAFTDLVHFLGRYWLVYREGSGHVSPDGTIRVCASEDGRLWSTVARIEEVGEDLRDPKLSVTPDGRLMLIAASVVRPSGGPIVLHNLVWFSRDGREWGESTAVGERDLWLWRVTWQGDRAWGIAYSTGHYRHQTRFVRLYTSVDGISFAPLGRQIYQGGYPSEHALLFAGDGTAWCLLRCDDEANTAMIGHAREPYAQWQWRPVGMRLGGPQMIADGAGQALVAARLYEGKTRTALCTLDLASATLSEQLVLPSGGDTSYPGVVAVDGGWLVSYYSAHEGPCRVYVARVARN